MKQTIQQPKLTLIPSKQASTQKAPLPNSAIRIRKNLRNNVEALHDTAKAMNIFATFLVVLFSIASGFVKKAAIAAHYTMYGVVSEKIGIVYAIVCCLLGLILAAAFVLYGAILTTVADSLSCSVKQLGKEVQK